MFHDEGCETTATSRWAATVRTLEQQLTARDTLVVRTHAYGWSPVSERAGFAERIWRGLSAGTLTGVDGRRHATPILATDLAELLWRAHEVRLSGLCHLAGAERTSPYHFAYALAAASNLNLPEVSSAGNAAADDRTALEETSLSSRRARRAMERATPLLRPGLERFAAQRHNGWLDRYSVVGPVATLATMAA
jgi:dTDP-4-dehydrorhamnose reductase